MMHNEKKTQSLPLISVMFSLKKLSPENYARTTGATNVRPFYIITFCVVINICGVLIRKCIICPWFLWFYMIHLCDFFTFKKRPEIMLKNDRHGDGLHFRQKRSGVIISYIYRMFYVQHLILCTKIHCMHQNYMH